MWAGAQRLSTCQDLSRCRLPANTPGERRPSDPPAFRLYSPFSNLNCSPSGPFRALGAGLNDPSTPCASGVARRGRQGAADLLRWCHDEMWRGVGRLET